MNHEDDDWDRNADICCEETCDGPVLRPEDGEAINERKDCEEDHCKPSAPRLHDVVPVWKLAFRNVLGSNSFAEANIGNAAADPRDEC